MTDYAHVEPHAATRSGPIADAGSFEAFFRRERPHVFGALVLITRDRQEAEDLTQDAFCKVWERWDRVAEMERPDGYLFAVALNLHRSRVRRSLTALRKALVTSEPSDELERVLARDEVLRALVMLPARQRAAIVVTRLLGFDSQEAATILNVTPGTVRALTSQGTAALRRIKEEPDDA